MHPADTLPVQVTDASRIVTCPGRARPGHALSDSPQPSQAPGPGRLTPTGPGPCRRPYPAVLCLPAARARGRRRPAVPLSRRRPTGARAQASAALRAVSRCTAPLSARRPAPVALMGRQSREPARRPVRRFRGHWYRHGGDRQAGYPPTSSLPSPGSLPPTTSLPPPGSLPFKNVAKDSLE